MPVLIRFYVAILTSVTSSCSKGAQLPPYDFAGSRAKLEEKYTADKMSDYDVMSHAMYPSVFDEFKEKQVEYGKVRRMQHVIRLLMPVFEYH